MNDFVFCMVPVFSDWIGILGLGVGTAGLILTLFTFWKVKTIQAVVDELQNRHLLRVRVPEILNELKRISDDLFDLNTRTSKAFSRKTIDRIQKNISTVRVGCNNIKRYLGRSNKKYNETGFSSLESLSALLEEPVLEESFYVRYRNLLSSLVAEIESFQKEMEARIP